MENSGAVISHTHWAVNSLSYFITFVLPDSPHPVQTQICGSSSGWMNEFHFVFI